MPDNATDKSSPTELRRGAAVAGALLYVVLVAWSHSYSEPRELPGAALGWPFLLHVERAALLLAVLGAVALVAWRGLHGEFPIKFGQVEYAAQEAAAEAAQIAAVHEHWIRTLERLNDIDQPADIEPGKRQA